MKPRPRSVGIELGSEPDLAETTTSRFRPLLEEHGLGAKIFEVVNTRIEAKGYSFLRGRLYFFIIS